MIQTPPPLHAILTIFILASVFPTVHAHNPIGTILSAEHQEIICSRAPDGSNVVSPDTLASILVNNAQVPWDLLDTANKDGAADKSVAFKELLHALFKNKNPFGPDRSKSQRAKRAKDRLNRERITLGDFVLDGKTHDGRFVLQTDSTAPMGPEVRLLFDDPTKTRILCVEPSQAEPEPTKPASSERRFLIRGKVSELALDHTALKSRGADTAEISFKSDLEKDVDTFGVSGVFGFNLIKYDFGDSKTIFIPYVRYEKTDTTGADSSDIEVLSPGLLWFVVSRFGKHMTAEWSLNPTATLDLEQDSERLTLRGEFGPSVSIGKQDWFGGDLDIPGPLLLRPDLKFQAEGSSILNTGHSLTIPEDYLGLGGEVELKIRIPDVKLLQDTAFSISFRHLEMLEDEVKNVNRFEAAVLYPLAEHTFVKFAYENGDNPETFQDEDFYKITLGLRY